MFSNSEPDTEFDKSRDTLIADGITFLRSLARYYGQAKGMEVYKKLMETVDPSLSDEIFMCLLTGEGRGPIVIYDIGPNKITAIREVRQATGLGLKEAKDLVEAVSPTTPQKITIWDEKNRPAIVEAFRTAGVTVR